MANEKALHHSLPGGHRLPLFYLTPKNTKKFDICPGEEIASVRYLTMCKCLFL